MKRYIKFYIIIIALISLFIQISETKMYSINTITTDTLKSKEETIIDTESNNAQQEIKLIKEPLTIHKKTILYVGAKDQLEAKYRTLNIRSNLDDAINQALNDNIQVLTAQVIENNGEYSLQLYNAEIIKVTEEDTKVNNQGSKKLAWIWKSNIDNIISDYTHQKTKKTTTDPLKNSFHALLFLLLFILFSELFRIKIAKYLIKISTTGIVKINGLLLQMQKKSSINADLQIKEETEITSLKGKINIITKELNTLLKIVIRALQIIAILLFINYTLYIFPETNNYIKDFTTFELSILFVIKETLADLLLSEQSWQTIGRILLITIATFIAIYTIEILSTTIQHILQALMPNDSGREKRIQTLINIIKTTIKIAIIALAIILILSGLGINVTPIIAGASIIGLAISFGSQNLVKDVINGIFILIENQFSIGDIIEIDGTGGIVENMTLRTTILRDLSGKAHIIPNGQITKVTVASKDWSRANLDISIAYKEDIDTAIKIIKETAEQMKFDFPDKIIAEPEVLGVNALSDSAIIIKLIITTAAAQQWFVEREYRRRIKYAFDQNNIEIPFPHRTVFINNSKE